MAVQRFKLSLSNARFPLVSTAVARAVFVPGLDSAGRTGRQFYGSEETIDNNVPQIIYGENVMPSTTGVKSVGYKKIVEPVAGAVDFDTVFALRDEEENTVLYSPAAGKNYINKPTGWESQPLFGPSASPTIYPSRDTNSENTAATAKVTYAYVDGKTLVCYSRLCSTNQRDYVITGVADTGSTKIEVTFNGVTYTYPGSSNLTVTGTEWKLTITSQWIAKAERTVTANHYTPATSPTPTRVETFSVFTGTDASLLYWSPEAQALQPAGALVTNLDIPPGEIDGIASSNGFLLVWSGITVHWAPFDGEAFDFSPYKSGTFTGAGTQIPEAVQGNIRAIVSLAGGFVAFTQRNAIAASYYAQNVASPWIFRELANAGGLESYEQATIEGSLSAIYAYTTAGVQRLSINEAVRALPDVSDFIAGRLFERCNQDTLELRQIRSTLDLFTKLTTIGNRYVVISYGTVRGVYSFALVYDLALERMGKLRIVHRDCFYYSYEAQVAPLTYGMLGDVPYNSPILTTYSATQEQSNELVAAPHGLAFLLANGEVQLADWSDANRDTPDSGIVYIGRIQLSRQSNVQLNRVEVEGLRAGSVHVQPSYDGYLVWPAEQLADIATVPNYAIKGGLVDCRNFNLIIKGTFALNTVIAEATTSGTF